MTERRNLLASIANTIKDYRAGEIPEPTPDHIDQWISQFDENVQLPMLRELDHVFKLTYKPKLAVKNFLESVATHEALVGSIPRDFWSNAHILNIQKNGRSQAEVRMLFGEILKERYGLNIDHGGPGDGALIYLDDAIFTGDRVIEDLAEITENIPPRAQLHIIVIAIHTRAEYWFHRNNRIAALSQRQITIQFWQAISFENRRTWRDQGTLVPTDILCPEEIGGRSLNERASRFFSSVNGRQLLEREFLRAGQTIRGFASNPSQRLKPLGYSPFDPGFGSLFVTYRNCPNNCPLALWYGDPSRPDTQPLGRWYPLFPRKTYDS